MAEDWSGSLSRVLDQNIYNPAQLIVINFGGGVDMRYAADRVQAGGLVTLRRAQRQRTEVSEIFHVILGILHCQKVIISRFGIDPIAGGDHSVGRERGDHAVNRFLGAQAQLTGALAINIQF